MENKAREEALDANPQNEPIYYGADEEVFERYYAAQGNPDPEDEEEEEEDSGSDWGHTDPTDSPFPDSNDPSGPGSAV